ncbi:MAG: hypothetical protein NT145_04725 [Elusimicrobia bacterium]|nr:hypothetical protein [Elusimicrobiota bacterium]
MYSKMDPAGKRDFDASLTKVIPGLGLPAEKQTIFIQVVKGEKDVTTLSEGITPANAFALLTKLAERGWKDSYDNTLAFISQLLGVKAPAGPTIVPPVVVPGPVTRPVVTPPVITPVTGFTDAEIVQLQADFNAATDAATTKTKFEELMAKIKAKGINPAQGYNLAIQIAFNFADTQEKMNWVMQAIESYYRANLADSGLIIGAIIKYYIDNAAKQVLIRNGIDTCPDGNFKNQMKGLLWKGTEVRPLNEFDEMRRLSNIRNYIANEVPNTPRKGRMQPEGSVGAMTSTALGSEEWELPLDPKLTEMLKKITIAFERDEWFSGDNNRRAAAKSSPGYFIKYVITKLGDMTDLEYADRDSILKTIAVSYNVRTAQSEMNEIVGVISANDAVRTAILAKTDSIFTSLKAALTSAPVIPPVTPGPKVGPTVTGLSIAEVLALIPTIKVTAAGQVNKTYLKRVQTISAFISSASEADKTAIKNAITAITGLSEAILNSPIAGIDALKTALTATPVPPAVPPSPINLREMASAAVASAFVAVPAMWGGAWLALTPALAVTLGALSVGLIILASIAAFAFVVTLLIATSIIAIREEPIREDQEENTKKLLKQIEIPYDLRKKIDDLGITLSSDIEEVLKIKEVLKPEEVPDLKAQRNISMLTKGTKVWVNPRDIVAYHHGLSRAFSLMEKFWHAMYKWAFMVKLAHEIRHIERGFAEPKDVLFDIGYIFKQILGFFKLMFERRFGDSNAILMKNYYRYLRDGLTKEEAFNQLILDVRSLNVRMPSVFLNETGTAYVDAVIKNIQSKLDEALKKGNVKAIPIIQGIRSISIDSIENYYVRNAVLSGLLRYLVRILNTPGISPELSSEIRKLASPIDFSTEVVKNVIKMSSKIEEARAKSVAALDIDVNEGIETMRGNIRAIEDDQLKPEVLRDVAEDIIIASMARNSDKKFRASEGENYNQAINTALADILVVQDNALKPEIIKEAAKFIIIALNEKIRARFNEAKTQPDYKAILAIINNIEAIEENNAFIRDAVLKEAKKYIIPALNGKIKANFNDLLSRGEYKAILSIMKDINTIKDDVLRTDVIKDSIQDILRVLFNKDNKNNFYEALNEDYKAIVTLVKYTKVGEIKDNTLKAEVEKELTQHILPNLIMRFKEKFDKAIEEKRISVIKAIRIRIDSIEDDALRASVIKELTKFVIPALQILKKDRPEKLVMIEPDLFMEVAYLILPVNKQDKDRVSDAINKFIKGKAKTDDIINALALGRLARYVENFRKEETVVIEATGRSIAPHKETAKWAKELTERIARGEVEEKLYFTVFDLADYTESQEDDHLNNSFAVSGIIQKIDIVVADRAKMPIENGVFLCNVPFDNNPARNFEVRFVRYQLEGRKQFAYKMIVIKNPGATIEDSQRAKLLLINRIWQDKVIREYLANLGIVFGTRKGELLPPIINLGSPETVYAHPEMVDDAYAKILPNACFTYAPPASLKGLELNQILLNASGNLLADLKVETRDISTLTQAEFNIYMQNVVLQGKTIIMGKIEDQENALMEIPISSAQPYGKEINQEVGRITNILPLTEELDIKNIILSGFFDTQNAGIWNITNLDLLNFAKKLGLSRKELDIETLENILSVPKDQKTEFENEDELKIAQENAIKRQIKAGKMFEKLQYIYAKDFQIFKDKNIDRLSEFLDKIDKKDKDAVFIMLWLFETQLRSEIKRIHSKGKKVYASYEITDGKDLSEKTLSELSMLAEFGFDGFRITFTNGTSITEDNFKLINSIVKSRNPIAKVYASGPTAALKYMISKTIGVVDFVSVLSALETPDYASFLEFDISMYQDNIDAIKNNVKNAAGIIVKIPRGKRLVRSGDTRKGFFRADNISGIIKALAIGWNPTLSSYRYTGRNFPADKSQIDMGIDPAVTTDLNELTPDQLIELIISFRSFKSVCQYFESTEDGRKKLKQLVSDPVKLDRFAVKINKIITGMKGVDANTGKIINNYVEKIILRTNSVTAPEIKLQGCFGLMEFIIGLGIGFEKDPAATEYEGFNKELHINMTAMANSLGMKWVDIHYIDPIDSITAKGLSKRPDVRIYYKGELFDPVKHKGALFILRHVEFEVPLPQPGKFYSVYLEEGSRIVDSVIELNDSKPELRLEANTVMVKSKIERPVNTAGMNDFEIVMYAYAYFQKNKGVETMQNLQNNLRMILNPLLGKIVTTGTLPDIMFKKGIDTATKKWAMSALFEMFDVVIERKAIRDFIRKSAQPSMKAIRGIISAA